MSLPEEETNAGAPGWVVTYADMMTLLLAFFVLLFSISEIKEEQGDTMVQSLRRCFGSEPAEAAAQSDSDPFRSLPLARLLSSGRTQRQERLQQGGKAGLLCVERPAAALVPPADVSVGEVVPFAENSAELSEAARRILQQLAGPLAATSQPVEIRGQVTPLAGTVPTPRRNPWDLAYARCRQTREYLVRLGIAPPRLRLLVEETAGPSGSGEGSPRVEVALRPTASAADSPQQARQSLRLAPAR